MPSDPDYFPHRFRSTLITCTILRCGNMTSSLECLLFPHLKLEWDSLLSFPRLFWVFHTSHCFSCFRFHVCIIPPVSSRISELVWGHQWPLRSVGRSLTPSKLYRFPSQKRILTSASIVLAFHGFVIPILMLLDSTSDPVSSWAHLPQVPHFPCSSFRFPWSASCCRSSHLSIHPTGSLDHPLATVTGFAPPVSLDPTSTTGLNPGTSGKKSPVSADIN